MPRIPQSQVSKDDLYGARKVETNLSFRDRCRKLFRAGDTVKVCNPTNQPVKWQWFDEQDEDYVIEDDTNIKITERGEPGLWELGAGEEDVLSGACAYVFLDSLYKQICILKIGIVISPLAENEIRNFSMDDPEKQDVFLEHAFLGHLSPQDMQAAAIRSLSETPGRGVQDEYVLPKLATEKDEVSKRRSAQRTMQQPLGTEVGEHKELADLAAEYEEGSTLLGTATGGLPTDDRRPVNTNADSGEGAPADVSPKAAKPKTKAKEPVKA